MLNVLLLITFQCVIVLPVILEMHCSVVNQYRIMVRHHRWSLYQSSIVLSAIYFELCYSVAYLPIPRNNACVPSPCGRYSECHIVKDHPVCSCLPEYFGQPPNCHPECTISAECAFDKSCHNQKCVDPCPGICGLHAMCRPVNHAAICSCMSGFTGDPFTRCVSIPESSKFRHYNVLSDRAKFQNV